MILGLDQTGQTDFRDHCWWQRHQISALVLLSVELLVLVLVLQLPGSGLL